MEINLNFILCHKDSKVINNKFTCYKGKYNIYLFLFITCSIIDFYIRLFYENFYFNKGDTFSYSFSRYIIMNSQIIFFIIKKFNFYYLFHFI